MEEFLLCCDWGTSSFRLFVVNWRNVQIIESKCTNECVSKVYDQWCGNPINYNIDRKQLYFNVIRRHIDDLANSYEKDFSVVPIIVSGMASSLVGLKELAYFKIPFHLTESRLLVHNLVIDFNCGELLLFSGLRSESDVMRGEEVQLIGVKSLLEYFQRINKKIVVVFAGALSKHIYIGNKEIKDFDTYVT